MPSTSQVSSGESLERASAISIVFLADTLSRGHMVGA